MSLLVLQIAKLLHLPLLWHQPQRRRLEPMRRRVAQLPVLVDAAGQQVVQQPGLDAPLLGDQRLGLLDGPIHCGEDSAMAVCSERAKSGWKAFQKSGSAYCFQCLNPDNLAQPVASNEKIVQ